MSEQRHSELAIHPVHPADGTELPGRRQIVRRALLGIKFNAAFFKPSAWLIFRDTNKRKKRLQLRDLETLLHAIIYIY